MRTGTVKLALAAAVVALACGCSTNTGGSAQPTGNSGSPTGGSSPSSSNLAEPGGAPKVKDPLDTTKWQQNPCSAVPASALAPLGFTAAGEVQTKPRPGCNWDNTDAGTSVALQFVTDASKGLSTIYQNRSNTTLFQPFTIDGFPALTYKQPSYMKGECSVAVGVTDKLYYETDTESLTSTDPCAAAKTMASAALTTMKSSG